jgi:ABC-2 type transport system ATP-binding protein
MTLLDIRNVAKMYGNRRVLNNITFSIKQGEIISLLGVNGAGKTTLSSIIATLQPPTSGDLLFHGSSIYKDIPEYRRQIGFCPQHPNLNNQLTVKQNLYYAGRAYRLSRTDAARRTDELLNQFRLEQYADALPMILSGGYKQRVLLARTWMHDPALIILDEPTVGLDPHVRQHLWQQILAFKNAGKSIVLTTHYMDEAEQLSDRVCVLDKGIIKFLDTPANLKANFAKANLESVFIELTKADEETV